MIDDLTMRDYLKVSDYLRVSGDTISKYKNNFFWINDSQIVINILLLMNKLDSAYIIRLLV